MRYLPHPLKQLCDFFAKIIVSFHLQLLTTKVKLGSGIMNYSHISSCKLLLVCMSKKGQE